MNAPAQDFCSRCSIPSESLSFGFIMPDAQSRARVQRLARGDIRSDDLTRLFLFARDHCDGRETVRDIGDFVAHHSERNRGIITKSTRDWFAVARYFFSNIAAEILDPLKMPAATKDYFEIAINRIDAQTIRNETGLRRPAANALMNEIVSRLMQNGDGTWALPNRTRSEHNLVNCVSSVMVVKPAFSADRLCEDFIATLKSNGLITKEEIANCAVELRNTIQLYAVAAMHHCVVQIGDGTKTQLKAKPEPGLKQIQVLAPIPNLFSAPNAPVTYVTTAMFTAELDPVVHCHPDLIANAEWDLEIEVAPDKRLSPLQ
ncbi:MAG: hypothetical protein ACXV8H_07775 [Chthoniobacterales bacterium]